MACLHVQLLGWYTGVCLAQSQGSEYVITFQGRSRLRISPSRYSCLISASGNPPSSSRNVLHHSGTALQPQCRGTLPGQKLPITNHPRVRHAANRLSRESPCCLTHFSPYSATSWRVPLFLPAAELPCSEKQGTHAAVSKPALVVHGGKGRRWSRHRAPPSPGPLERGPSWAELG